jgi:hypothetical protein
VASDAAAYQAPRSPELKRMPVGEKRGTAAMTTPDFARPLHHPFGGRRWRLLALRSHLGRQHPQRRRSDVDLPAPSSSKSAVFKVRRLMASAPRQPRFAQCSGSSCAGKKRRGHRPRRAWSRPPSIRPRPLHQPEC